MAISELVVLGDIDWPAAEECTYALSRAGCIKADFKFMALNAPKIFEIVRHPPWLRTTTTVAGGSPSGGAPFDEEQARKNGWVPEDEEVDDE